MAQQELAENGAWLAPEAQNQQPERDLRQPNPPQEDLLEADGESEPRREQQGPTAEEGAPATARVNFSLQVPAGARLRITVETLPAPEQPADARLVIIQDSRGASEPVVLTLPVSPSAGTISLPGARSARPAFSRSIRGKLREAWRAWPVSLPAALFGLALLVYLGTRLVGLTRFPIYFFTDEAVHSVLASDLLRDNFKNYAGDFLPTFFENGGKYRLGASVYLYLLPVLLFGKSVFTARLVSVLVGLGAALAVGLMLRDGFHLRYWWSGVLVLSITPAWFLHSRTAFEYPMAVSFYALFLYFYLLYRSRDPKYLVPSLVCGALSFYTYSPMQVVVPLTGTLLLFSDLAYHWERRRQIIPGLALLALLAAPYLRFQITHSQANHISLVALGSYWTRPIPLQEKLRLYFGQYLHGLSPGFWFSPAQPELIRHLMLGYGNLLQSTLPFFLAGLVIAVRHWRSSTHRLALIALLAAPSGAAMVEIGVTRALVMVIPAALLTVIGLAAFLHWLETRRLPAGFLSFALFAVLAAVNLWMLRDALVNGPTWYDNYGMGGMQYGAAQVFHSVKGYLKDHPGTKLIFSPNWANGADVLARFFFPDPLPFQIGSIDGYLTYRQPLDEKTTFVMIPEEYQEILTSGKFTGIQVDQSLPYPDGQTGFYFVRLRYVDNIDQIMASEQEARRTLQEGAITIQGQPAKISYSKLDIGDIQNVWDGDLNTLARTLEANPFVMEIVFSQPRQLSGLSLVIGSTQVRVTASLSADVSQNPVEYGGERTGTVEHPAVSLAFPQPVQASSLRLVVQDLHQGEPGHVHIWEVTLR